MLNVCTTAQDQQFSLLYVQLHETWLCDLCVTYVGHRHTCFLWPPHKPQPLHKYVSCYHLQLGPHADVYTVVEGAGGHVPAGQVGTAGHMEPDGVQQHGGMDQEDIMVSKMTALSVGAQAYANGAY